MIRLFSFLFIFCALAGNLFAQSGTLSGKIVNSEEEELPLTVILIKHNDSIITGGNADYNGSYTIKPVPPNTYDIEISLSGYSSAMVKGVKIVGDSVTILNMSLKPDTTNLHYRSPLDEKMGTSHH